MSKDLEYEVNNFANLLHKDCMNLMECLKKQDKDNKPIFYLGKHYEKVILPYEEYQKMCNRLESIDNAEPSEALKCLEKLEECAEGMKDLPKSNWIDLAENEAELDLKIMDWVETIKFELFKGKQALLKAQEPKQYLKWEDLEFKDYEQEISVLLNGNKYSVKYYTYDIGDMAYLYKENRNIFVFDGRYSEDKQFFNDLHLERVEE